MAWKPCVLAQIQHDRRSRMGQVQTVQLCLCWGDASLVYQQIVFSLFRILNQYCPYEVFMTSHFRFLTKFLKFLSFKVLSAMNRTPSTFWSFRGIIGVSSSDSLVALRSIVALIPSVIKWWLVYSCNWCVFVMVGGSRFGMSFSWLHWVGLTRRTSYSYFSCTSTESLVWLATVIAVSSVCAAWVAIFVSVANDCVSVTGVLLLNTIFGKFECFLGFDDKSSRASLTSTVGRGVVTLFVTLWRVSAC